MISARGYRHPRAILVDVSSWLSSTKLAFPHPFLSVAIHSRTVQKPCHQAQTYFEGTTQQVLHMQIVTEAALTPMAVCVNDRLTQKCAFGAMLR
jgi:hypothetical protein